MTDIQDKTKTEEIKTAKTDEETKKAETAKADGGVKNVPSYKAEEKDAK